MSFYNDPVLWNEGSQITADTIHIIVKNGSIDQLQTSVNSFIISEDSTENYNQIKGRQMIAYFDGKNIKNVNVTGNGESIYFVADEENPKLMIGMNKIICSNMNIIFKEDQVNDIRFYTNPDGDFVPPHELKKENKTLEGFAWRIDERPSRRLILVDPEEVRRKMELVDSMIEAEKKEKEALDKISNENEHINQLKEEEKKQPEIPQEQ
jgi:hypothetical protein